MKVWRLSKIKNVDVSDFIWVEFSPSRLHYDLMLTYSDMLNEREKPEYKNNEMFISRYMYNRDNPYSGPVLSNLYFDFDDKEKLNKAKADCLAAAEYFNQTAKIPFESMKIRFTGGKGFSLEIPFQYFNVEPTPHLPRIWKRIIEKISIAQPLKTLDRSVYHRRVLWRLTNTRHRSGCYKIYLTYQELKRMRIDEVRTLARQGPRKYLYTSDLKQEYEPIPQLVTLFQETKREIEKEWQEMIQRKIEKIGTKPVTLADFDPKKIFPCIEARIQKGVDIEQDSLRREPTAFNIAVALHNQGASDEYILARLKEFAQNCVPEFPLQRYPEFDHIIEMVNQYDYSTHCFTAGFVELCDKSACRLHTEKTRSLTDLNFEEDVQLKVLHGAGGATDLFIYETFYVQSEYAEICWVLVWYDGKEAGMELVSDEGKIVDFVEIKGVNYKILMMPCLYLETLWDKKSAYQFVKTLQTPDPKEVYKRVEATIKYFVDCDDGTDVTEGRYVFGACWSIATYFYEQCHFFPYNLARGFMLSGKTTWMLACGYQAYHSYGPIVNPSPASIFRTIETAKPTLLLDNAERLYDSKSMDDENRKIVEMLDVGAYSGGKVPRVEGKNETGYVVKEWNVFCPKAITTVKGVAKSLTSRSVPMDMIQTNQEQYGERRGELWANPRYDFDVKAAEIRSNRNDLYILRMTLWNKVLEVSRSLRSNEFRVKSRQWDMWKIIVTIAKIFCPDKIPALIKFIEETTGVMQELQADEEKEGMLRVLKNIYRQDGWYALKGIAELYRQHREMIRCSSQEASRILKDLGFKKRKRIGHDRLVHALINASTLDRQLEAIGQGRQADQEVSSRDSITENSEELENFSCNFV